MKKLVLDSLEKLHRLLPVIFKKVNDDPALALAAAANPLRAIEELGYQIDPPFRSELEDLVRFKPEIIEKLTHLREEIYRHAKHTFDLNSAAELHAVLFDELKLPAIQPKSKEKTSPYPLQPTAPLPPQVGWGPRVKDPLEKLRGKHPIMDPLLEYRWLEASAPRLANQELYQEIRNGSRPTPAARISFIAKRIHN